MRLRLASGLLKPQRFDDRSLDVQQAILGMVKDLGSHDLRESHAENMELLQLLLSIARKPVPALALLRRFSQAFRVKQRSEHSCHGLASNGSSGWCFTCAWRLAVPRVGRAVSCGLSLR